MKPLGGSQDKSAISETTLDAGHQHVVAPQLLARQAVVLEEPVLLVRTLEVALHGSGQQEAGATALPVAGVYIRAPAFVANTPEAALLGSG